MSTAAPGAPLRGKFTAGSTMHHIIVMTSSAAAGLLGIFLAEFANLYFLSLLGEVEVAAAIGYAGSIVFFTISTGIGLSIAATALTAPALGAGDHATAERLTLNVHLFSAAMSSLLALLLWWFVPTLLTQLGASGRTHELATGYLRILIPSMPVLALAMCSAAVLRAAGDAKRSMYVTLCGALANAALDPILIFVLGLGVDGAAIASVIARFVMMGAGFYGLIKIQRLLTRPEFHHFWPDVRAIAAIAVPAILTNIAAPVNNAYVTVALAPFGDSAVAGWAIIGRIIPLAFVGIFAMSGAVGPVLGQNLGASAFDRVRGAFTNALIVVGLYTAAAWVSLALLHEHIAAFFNVSGEAAELIGFFCLWLSPAFAFLGGLFIANAALNNLGRPQLPAVLNWGRATIGTIPFVMLGGHYFGSSGVLAGNMVGALLFGLLAVALCYRHIARLDAQGSPPPPASRRWLSRTLWPFSSPRP